MMCEYITIEEIYEAYYDCRYRKRNKNSALKYELNYEVENHKLWKELNAQTYEIGYSLAFCVTRPKLREVFAADFRDRIVHHLIMLKFLPLIEREMIDDSYNCRKGKGSMYAVDRVKGFIEEVSEGYEEETWVLKCDIQGFFMSINKDILWRELEGLIRREYTGGDIEWWLWLIKKVIMHRPERKCYKRGNLRLWEYLPRNKSLFTSNGKGLPIGNLTSQIFGNFYLTVFDKWVLSWLNKNEKYGRFVDDFVIISQDKRKLLNMIPHIRAFLKERLDIRLHPDKIYLQEVKKGLPFVGSVVKPNRKYTGNRTVNAMFEKIRYWLEDESADDEKFVMSINSYFGFLIHNNSYGIRYRAWLEIASKGRNIIMVGRMHHLKLKNNTDMFTITTVVTSDYKEVEKVGSKFVHHFYPVEDEETGMTTCVEYISKEERDIEELKAEYDTYKADLDRKAELRKNKEEVKELKQRLASTDYMAIKFAEGWITAEDYAPTKAQRQEWRDRINELENSASEGE